MSSNASGKVKSNDSIIHRPTSAQTRWIGGGIISPAAEITSHSFSIVGCHIETITAQGSTQTMRWAMSGRSKRMTGKVARKSRHIRMARRSNMPTAAAAAQAKRPPPSPMKSDEKPARSATRIWTTRCRSIKPKCWRWTA